MRIQALKFRESRAAGSVGAQGCLISRLHAPIAKEPPFPGRQVAERTRKAKARQHDSTAAAKKDWHAGMAGRLAKSRRHLTHGTQGNPQSRPAH
jgi:hypothetical protein